MSGVLFDDVQVDYFRLLKFQRFFVILQRCHLISLYYALITLFFYNMFKNANQLLPLIQEAVLNLILLQVR